MTSPEEKRLFIGGLVKGVKEEELVEKFSRFGQVANVEIKTRTSDTDSKTFAYLNLTAEDNAFKKCFTAYNNTKWKGGQLKLQFAKESFLSKLKKEQVEAKASKEKDKRGKATPVHKSPALESDRKAVPGTPMDEKETWVMGKYSRVLPVLNLRKPGTRKIVTLDPSKLSHCVKKLKADDYDAEKHSDLTWHLEENTSDINKLRQGQFPKMEAPRHHSTPKDPSDSKQDSIFSRLQGLAAEERVSDTEMEVVPVGKSGSVSKIGACSGYDSEDSAGSADTDDIVFKASGKKRSKPAVRDSVTAAEPKSKKKKKSVGRDDTLVNDESAASSNLSTPLEKLNGKKTTNSLGTRKEPHVKNRKLDVKDTNTEENKKPQFQFVKTPALKGKVLKKSAKLSQSEMGSANRGDKHEGVVVKDPTPCDRRKSANKTPEFKGLGMLSNDSEDNLPPSRSVNKTPEFKGLGMLSSDSEDDQPPSRPKTAASFAAKSSGLGVQSFTDDISELESGSRTDSFRARQKEKSKRAQPVSSEDSDLDDNDLEKVAKKLAARALDKRQQGAGSGASFRSADGPNTTRKRKSSQAEDVQLTSLQKSHQAYNKIQQQQKEKEKIITKNLREGTTESKIVKFSDSDDEKGLKKKAAKMVLFSDGDSDSDAESDVDFSFRPQFEGSKGQKLFELQSRLKDKRFRFDERFQSSDSDEDQTMAPQESEDEMAAERKRNQDILEKVLGYKPRQRTRLVYEAMSQRRYNPDAVHSASEAKPEIRKKVSDSELRATPPGDSEPDDSEEDTKDSSSSDHMEQGVQGESDSEQETDHDVDGHSDSEHTEQDSEEESDSELAEHSAKAGERSGAECTVQGKDETSSAVKGQSLKGLFSGGSSFAFFGAPDGEGVKDMEEDAEEDGEDEEEEEEGGEEPELKECRAISQRRYNPDAVHSASEAKPEKRKKVDDGKPRIADSSDSDIEQQTSKSDDSENTEEDSSSDHMEQDSDSEAVEDSGGDRTDEGKGLQGLFSGGSSFTLFGAPGGEGVKETAVFSDMEEDAKEDKEDEEEEEDEEESELNKYSVADRLKPPVQQQPSFMVSRDDPRLTAAVKFFKRPHEEEFAELCERWGEERQKIMELVRDRHKKACRKERQKKQGMQSRPFVKTKMQTHRKAKKW